jgi:Zn-dependent M16 (insulinase) family peptidase
MYCIDRNISEGLDLIREICRATLFEDKERAQTALLMALSSMSSSLANAGHSFAMKYASSLLLASRWLGELYGGITQLHFLETLATTPSSIEEGKKEEEENPLDILLDKMQQLYHLVFARPCVRVSITGTDEGLQISRRYLDMLLRDWSTVPIQTAVLTTAALPIQPQQRNIFLHYAIPINFIARAHITVPYSHPDSVALSLASELLTKNFLHRELREKGGAYGGGASFSSIDGILSFYSYRDPNYLRTVESFQRAYEFLAGDGRMNDEDLNEAKLALFARIDEPVSPSNRGQTMFKFGISDDLRQRRREAILAVTLKDIKRVAEQYLINYPTNCATVAIGSVPTTLPEGWTLQHPKINY